MSHEWYHTTRWRKASRLFLRRPENVFCKICLKHGKHTVATVVDHITPHKGNYDLFWDQDGWQGLCKPCHNKHKQFQDNRGFLPGCDKDGIPIDENHPWRKRK